MEQNTTNNYLSTNYSETPIDNSFKYVYKYILNGEQLFKNYYLPINFVNNICINSGIIKKEKNNINEFTNSELDSLIYILDKNFVDVKMLFGRGYDLYINNNKKYNVAMGGRKSKKSKVTALKCIYNLIRYPWASLIVYRKYFKDHKESTFSDLLWALDCFKLRQGIDYTINMTTLKITFIKTNQVILFIGVQEALSTTSLSNRNTSLAFTWFEEAYQLESESDFDTIIEGMRLNNNAPTDAFLQVNITFNPWSERHWLNDKFFKTKKEDALIMSTNYRINEFLREEDILEMEEIKRNNPRRARIVVDGEWGIESGLVFEDRYKVRDFEPKQLPILRGIDYGETNDPTAYVAFYIDVHERKIYIFDEYYKRNKRQDDILNELFKTRQLKNQIVFAETKPAYNSYFSEWGSTIIQAYKPTDSNAIPYQLQMLTGYEIIIHPRCVNFIMEIENYALDEKTGKPVDKDNHLMDAFRYANNALFYPDKFKYVYRKGNRKKEVPVNNIINAFSGI